MFDDILVVLPARGGSKRIPHKNIKTICGQPMIYWPLMELLKLFKSSNVLVSTDSEEIKNLVEEKGLKVPFVRPEKLSDDYTGTAEVVLHALNWFESHVKPVKAVLTVYPTAVFLNSFDIEESIKLLLDDECCDGVMSTTTFPYPFQRAVFLNGAGYTSMFEPENFHKRSQDFPEAYHDAAQFYLNKAESLRCGKILINSNIRMYRLPRNMVVDIDTKEDLDIVTEKLNRIRGSNYNKNWSF